MELFRSVFTLVLLVFIAQTAVFANTKKPMLVKGTSKEKYAKPGAPVHMSYTTEHTEKDQVSKVEILLETHVSKGKMDVRIKIDKGLEVLSGMQEHLSFKLDEGKKEYPLNFEVLATEDGLYYVKLLVSIKGQGMRAFWVPVYVGDGIAKDKKVSPVEKTSSGEVLSISPAQEEIITK